MRSSFLLLVFLLYTFTSFGQVSKASRSGFTWISTEDVEDKTYGNGYTLYSAAWPIFKDYPGPRDFQMGLAGCWLTTQRTGTEPNSFYTTIEGGLGWWHDTRFGTSIPKFIMGGVSHDFYAWANGPGAGRSRMLGNGQRDWSTPGGKYGVAQLSNRLLWAPDGLNMAQSLNGEMLGYGYTPLPLTDVMEETGGQDITTGNQCWTLFLNTSNFKGPATFFLPTFWTEPVLENPSLEGLFLDSRPSEPNIGFGIEHAGSPALVSTENDGSQFAKIARLQYPASNEDNSMLLNQISVYNQEALWMDMINWFNGGPAVEPSALQSGARPVSFVNNGGARIGEISSNGMTQEIQMSYLNNTQLNASIMGYSFDLNQIKQKKDLFVMPEYFKLGENNRWMAMNESELPATSPLLTQEVPLSDRPAISYLTPLDPECQWQDPEGPWNSPGPSAGPFTADLGDGSTVTYYWYRFIDQPAIIHANLPEAIRQKMQERVELIHQHWSHEDTYAADPEIGTLTAIDPEIIVQPPAGMEVGYVPIVTRQEASPQKLRIFVLAGQSNMEGFGTVVDAENDPGSLVDVLSNDEAGEWSEVGVPSDWTILDNAYIYFANNGDTLRTNVSVGQGNNPNLIGPELMFAHELDAYYEDPILIIKTAWGGKSLAEDFRPPSADGERGEYYDAMIETVQEISQNLDVEFPALSNMDYEITGFAWFQGWNDGASDDFLNEYESNLHHLVADVRRDLDIEDLPIIIANSGHGGYESTNDGWVQSMQNVIAVAQENVACNDSIYGGRLGFVDTKPFYRDASESPQNGVHHFHNNAWTYLNIGREIGREMKRAINDMAYCYEDCSEQVSPGILSIGNRVWNDLNRNGINEPDEPGIPGVSLVIWEDSDGDGIPDWQGFGGVQITDEDGYYRFTGLQPGPYIVFVWSVNNWGPGEALEGFQSTNGFVPEADNDVDFDNNGFGGAFTDIKSGIVQLSFDDEPLNDGDPFNCYFDYDANGNNTIDFGFFDPNVTSYNEIKVNKEDIIAFPNPVRDYLALDLKGDYERLQIFDTMGQLHFSKHGIAQNEKLNFSHLPKGLYFLHFEGRNRKTIKVFKL
jgi:hypothetical protein